MIESPPRQQGVWQRIVWLFLVVPQPDSSGRTPFERFSDLFPHINFRRPVPLDLLRIPLQILWLILVKPSSSRPVAPGRSQKKSFIQFVWNRKGRRTSRSAEQNRAGLNTMAAHRFWDHPLVYGLSLICCSLIIAISIMAPFDLQSQALFVLLLWVLAMMIRKIPGQLVTIVLVVFSFTASSRYLWWRCNSTLNWNDPLSLFLGLLLLVAEVYIWFVLLLGYFQTAWPVQRTLKDLPANPDDWPTVDIFIPTYNEPLHVVRPTIYAAQAMDWPRDKINIYLLDDGCRSDFRNFAEKTGVHYFERPESTHAKAGNLNLALTKTCGEFIAIFDCDHIPARSFLQTSMGLLVQDRKLAVVQTPHHFFSADPFERNLNTVGTVPNENELFYGLIQDGNDLWNATFFCGSCAIIRRGPLEEVGGIAVETVTEDAHTALRLHRRGYRSAFLSQPQAAGLATESLSAHIGQRIRWARGMTQIFRTDNPLLGKGLTLGQRLCYTNGMLHFLNGIPRLIFLTSPLAFLLFKAYIIYASAAAIFLYVLPHLLLSIITNSRVQGRYRFTFWSEIYETALAWYIARPTTIALLSPHKGRFNVTEKGGLVEAEFFDWGISKPFLVLVFLNLLGFGFGIHHLFFGDPLETQTVYITMLWTMYNITILGAALAVTAEVKQVRSSHRVDCDFPVTLHLKNGHCIHAGATDYSEGGFGIMMPAENMAVVGESLILSLQYNGKSFVFPVHVTNIRGRILGVHFDQLSPQQEKDLVHCTFSRADAWVDKREQHYVDRPLQNLKRIVIISARGYGRLAKHISRKFRLLTRAALFLRDYLLWLLPRNPSILKR